MAFGSHVEMGRDLQVPAHDLDKERIASRRPDRGKVAYGPEDDADHPQPEAKAERRC